MKFKNIVIILLIFTSCFSCDTELEEEIFSTYSADTFYENEDQLQAQNLGIYQAFRHVVWEQDMYFLGTMPHRYATARQPGFAIHSAYNTADQ